MFLTKFCILQSVILRTERTKGPVIINCTGFFISLHFIQNDVVGFVIPAKAEIS